MRCDPKLGRVRRSVTESATPAQPEMTRLFVASWWAMRTHETQPRRIPCKTSRYRMAVVNTHSACPDLGRRLVMEKPDVGREAHNRSGDDQVLLEIGGGKWTRTTDLRIMSSDAPANSKADQTVESADRGKARQNLQPRRNHKL
jgi:hypothetical protein